MNAYSGAWWRAERVRYPLAHFRPSAATARNGECMVDLTYPAMLELFPEFIAKGRSESASFLIWYLVNYYRLDPVEAVDTVCDQGGNRGIDGIFVNDNEQTITVLQSKISQSDRSSIGDASLRTFAGALGQFATPDAVAEMITASGTNQLANLLRRLDIASKIQTHELRGEFISNINIDDNGTSFLATCPMMAVVGKTDLESSYISDSRELPTNAAAVLDILGFDVTEYSVDAKTKAVIVPVKARQLVELDGISDQSLFAYNVRGPLGKTQVNRDIVKSIKDQAKHKLFPLFHNGITIIAGGIERTQDTMTISEYYVVNGCQSLSALYDNRNSISDDLRVLAKIIQLDPSSHEAEEITRFSNNQNGVKARDFKSNNPIQIRLQNEFVANYGEQFSFEIKTGERLPPGEVITNESAGLMLMAFDIKEPWVTHRRYEVWEEKHSALFARPEVTSDRIVFLKIVTDIVDAQLVHIENELCRKYVLTRYMMLYIVRLVVDKEAVDLLNTPALMVRDSEQRTRFVAVVTSLISELAIDLNYEVKSLGDDFDYRGRLREKKWVEETSQRVAASRAKDVARGKAEPLSEMIAKLS